MFTVIFFVWLLALTVLIFGNLTALKRLSKEGKSKTIAQILQEILEKEEKNSSALKALEARHSELEKLGQLHVQKLGLARFNPFKDTGGDQSFILALLDAQDTGVIISSLHTRTGTRWYAKKVVKGKGIEYELSDEEKKALKETSALEDTEL